MSMGPGVQHMLDLSTAHMPETHPDFGGLRVTHHEYGFVVFVSPDEEEGDHESAQVPEWLQPIHKEAVALGCILVNFDRDAEQVERFQTWSW